MATKVAKKPRTKKILANITHTIFGPGSLLERRSTPNGNDVLVVRFPDETRTLLAASKYWLTLPDLGVIPVANKAGVTDEPDEEPRIERDGVEGDVGPELAA